MKITHRLSPLALSATLGALSATAWAKPTAPAPAAAPAAASAQAQVSIPVMHRAQAGTGTLRLGTGQFTVTSASLILLPAQSRVQVLLETPRGRLWMNGRAMSMSGDRLAFTLEHGSGSLATALRLPKGLAGNVSGNALLSRGQKSFQVISLEGRLSNQVVSVSFRSNPLKVPAKKAPVKRAPGGKK